MAWISYIGARRENQGERKLTLLCRLRMFGLYRGCGYQGQDAGELKFVSACFPGSQNAILRIERDRFRVLLLSNIC